MKSFREYITEATAASGIFRKRWGGIFMSDIEEYAKKNKLFLFRSKQYPEIIYGALEKKAKDAVFSYDSDEMTMRSDYAPIDFARGRIRQLEADKDKPRKGYFK